MNNPNNYLLNKENDVLSGLIIDRQYIVSSNKPAPSKSNLINEYEQFILQSEKLAKVYQTYEIGKHKAVPEQIDLHFFRNLTKGGEEGEKQGVYAHNLGQKLHIEEILPGDEFNI